MSAIDEEIVDHELVDLSVTPTNKQTNKQSIKQSDDSEIVFDSQHVDEHDETVIEQSTHQTNYDSSVDQSYNQSTFSRLLCQSGSSLLAAAEYMGEGLASMLGITDSRYQYVIDAQDRADRVMKMEEEEDAINEAANREAAEELERVVQAAHERWIEEGKANNQSIDHSNYEHLSSEDRLAITSDSAR